MTPDRSIVAMLTASVLALSVATPLASGARSAPADVLSIAVDLSTARQVIQGFGSSDRVWSDPHLSKSPNTNVPPAVQAQILTALYRRLGLTRVRDVLDPGIQKVQGGPFDFSGKLGDAQIAFVRQAKQYGLRTFFPGPVYLEDWMQASDPGSYVDYAMGVLGFWRKMGLEPPFYAPLNEPQVSHDFPPQWMHDVVLQLGQRLRAAGFKTKLVIPDDENPADAYRRAVAVLQDPNARQYVGALAYHIYHGSEADMVRMRQLATRYGLPVWMTEFSSSQYTDWSTAFDWAVKMNTVLTVGGVNAVDYLWGYFGSWVQTDTMISIQFDNGAYRSFAPTPIYWITGQYSRYVRPGYVRVAATPSAGPVLASAYTGPKRAIVVATNPSGSTQTLRVTVVGGKLKGVVRPVQSSASEQWKTLAPIVPRGGSFTAALPPQSITTFVATR